MRFIRSDWPFVQGWLGWVWQQQMSERAQANSNERARKPSPESLFNVLGRGAVVTLCFELRAVTTQYDVDLVGHSRDEPTEKIGRRLARTPLVKLGKGKIVSADTNRDRALKGLPRAFAKARSVLIEWWRYSGKQ